jgi:hypothetical protein
VQPGILKLVRSLEEQGCRVRYTRGGVFVYLPDGVTTMGFHTSKHSDKKTLANIKAEVRRAGLEWPKGVGA